MAKSNLSSGIYNLEDLALETGSTIEYSNGKKFNSAGVEGQRRVTPKEPVVKQVPAPEPVAKPQNNEIVNQLLALLNRPIEVKVPPVQPPQVTVNPPSVTVAPVTWVFDFERNANGTIKRITATPQE